MERRAQAAESLVARSSGQVALDHAIQAADLYMRAAAEAKTKPEATRLRQKCQQLITVAERLKTSQTTKTPVQQPGELQQTSHLHGNYFPPWTTSPANSDFRLLPGDIPFSDKAALALSTRQAATFDGWKSPRELYGVGQDINDEVFMDSGNGCDLVQDLTTDCSVVASLCAAMRIMTGRHSVLASIFYPFDKTRGMPKFSASGKYVLRLHFNGCFRRVVIDERLPASLTDRTLYVVDRRNPFLIWPALLEKAYLKVRGGYDFPGSNSGTDLWVLTGWIPEQLFLQREDLHIDIVWKRIKTAHDSEDVVVTLGTGRISTEEEEVLGLIGEHDYAVMALDMIGDTRRLLVKNPWCNGPVWKGTTSNSPSTLRVNDKAECVQLGEDSSLDQLPVGSFWMSLEDVVQHFESMYLNWNPARFAHRQDHHFTWKIPPARFAPSLVRNPQYSLECPNGGKVWILASRHFRDAELQIARTRTDSMAAVSRQLGFMSILVFDNEGHRVQVSDGEVYRGPYVDSPQTLARLDTNRRKRYTIVLDQHEFPLPDYTLTLSVFSQEPIGVREARDAMSHYKESTGTWSKRTAGGNAACSTYLLNPQFRLDLPHASPVSILISTDVHDVHVHVDLVWAQGKRVTTLRARDVVGSSGEYRRGCSVANIPLVDPGIYTIVCSTFDAGQMAEFALRVSSMTPATLEPIPADVAGRFQSTLPLFRLSEEEEVRRMPLSVSWLTRMSIRAQSVAPVGAETGSWSASTLAIRISVAHGWAPERTLIATSGDGDFQDLKAGVRTPEFDMEPGRILREGMWLVVESMGTHNVDEDIKIELHSDAPVQVGPWELM
ncbi:Calpain-like protease palB/cpr-8 [Neonectria ditissima]|uniref:Calpain-like protease palB/cpr-8 n=1 Tax=Neonectria ditissima TaxID=78410 RepID=A0A0P7BLV4_9HYPO|nr:Calpain-like protease palB/cpr-8 [Neonectria ditissima]